MRMSERGESPPAAVEPRPVGVRATWILLLAINVLRFGFAFTFDLVPQEAYYLLYAKNLALSYFDHPPVLAWILRAFIEVFGDREWVLRFAMFCLSITTQAIWISMAKKVLGDRWTN
ncbi:MAG: glycosyltransferase family 39 protein, partial [Myxococcaceae bacterium]